MYWVALSVSAHMTISTNEFSLVTSYIKKIKTCEIVVHGKKKIFFFDIIIIREIQLGMYVFTKMKYEM